MRRLLAVLCCLAAMSGCHGTAEVVQEPPASTASMHAEPEPEHMVESGPRSVVIVAHRPSVPRQVRIGGAIRARVVPVAVEGGVLTPPADPTVLGWWGSLAGAHEGVTLLTGHTVHAGGGALDDLEHVRLGEAIEVGGHLYRVTSVRVVSKAWLSEHATQLFSQTGEHRLVVVTCEDYDLASRTYASNVVLEARS